MAACGASGKRIKRSIQGEPSFPPWAPGTLERRGGGGNEETSQKEKKRTREVTRGALWALGHRVHGHRQGMPLAFSSPTRLGEMTSESKDTRPMESASSTQATARVSGIIRHDR